MGNTYWIKLRKNNAEAVFKKMNIDLKLYMLGFFMSQSYKNLIIITYDDDDGNLIKKILKYLQNKKIKYNKKIKITNREF
jgi:ABC-type metal ion transport system substrate-binding protein